VYGPIVSLLMHRDLKLEDISGDRSRSAVMLVIAIGALLGYAVTMGQVLFPPHVLFLTKRLPGNPQLAHAAIRPDRPGSSDRVTILRRKKR
jgi:hypothetical protein